MTLARTITASWSANRGDFVKAARNKGILTAQRVVQLVAVLQSLYFLGQHHCAK